MTDENDKVAVYTKDGAIRCKSWRFIGAGNCALLALTEPQMPILTDGAESSKV